MTNLSSFIAFQRGAPRRMRDEIQGTSELLVRDTLPKNYIEQRCSSVCCAELEAMR